MYWYLPVQLAHLASTSAQLRWHRATLSARHHGVTGILKKGIIYLAGNRLTCTS